MNDRTVIRSAAIVSKGTALSRLLGFVREMLMAYFFGTSFFQSAFTVAFTVPNLFRRLFGEGALSAAFIPVLAETMEKEGKERARELAGRVIVFAGLVLTCVVIVGAIGTSIALRYVDSAKWQLILSLLRIMLPYTVLICLVALCMAILNTLHHFAIPALTPVLLNVVWIGVLVAVCPRFGDDTSAKIHALAWGIVLGGVVQLAFQFPALIREGFLPKISFSLRGDARLKRVLVLMAPAALGMGVFQVNTMIDHVLAFVVSDWAAAALRFSERLIYLPMGIFATALGTVLLPVFARQAAQSNSDEMRTTLNMSLRNLLFVTLPASVGMVVLARPIVQLVFERGMFNADSTLQTSRALMVYGSGLVVFSLHKVFVPAFYALKDTVTPVRTSLIAVAVNLTLNIAFILTWPYEFKHAGIALATVVSSFVNCTMLAILFHRRVGSPGWGTVLRSLVRIAGGSVLVGIAARLAHGGLLAATESMGAATRLCRGVSVVGAIAVAVAVYACYAAIMCRAEWREVVGSLRRKKHTVGS